MPNNFSLEWNGKAFSQKFQRAAIAGIDETMAESVDDAQKNVPVDTGLLQSNIKVLAEAEVQPNGDIEGTWGVDNVRRGPNGVFYAIFVETMKPFLRPAQDREYHKLADRIKKRIGP